MKNYDEASVIRALNKKVGCNVNSVNKTITIDKTSDSLGNRSWGKIDFLVTGLQSVHESKVQQWRKCFERLVKTEYINNLWGFLCAE